MKYNQTYLEQINKYYSHKLGRYDLIHIGMTPDVLVSYGANKLPLVMQQSTLTKCIRKKTGSRSAHDLDRNMIESLPEQIRHPVLLIEERMRNSFALISDYKDKNGLNMLIALKLNTHIKNIYVNEVVSFYGRNNLEIYIQKHDLSEIHIIDINKAKQFAGLLGLQLPTTLQVNEDKPSVIDKLNNFKRNNQKSSGEKELGSNLAHQREER